MSHPDERLTNTKIIQISPNSKQSPSTFNFEVLDFTFEELLFELPHLTRHKEAPLKMCEPFCKGSPNVLLDSFFEEGYLPNRQTAGIFYVYFLTLVQTISAWKNTHTTFKGKILSKNFLREK